MGRDVLMKTEITYICEICDKDFDNEIDALINDIKYIKYEL
jgi:hypothetical protein